MKLKSMTLEEFISRCFPGEVYPPDPQGVVISAQEFKDLLRILDDLSNTIYNSGMEQWKADALKTNIEDIRYSVLMRTNNYW